jgi:UDP-glucose 4-epimerase
VKVLVTGGAGFIGTNLVRRLLVEGHEPIAFDDFSTGLESNLTGLDVRVERGSLVDTEAVARAADGVDAIVHLAARGSVPRSVEYPVATHEVNATGTLHVLEAARRHGVQVIMSSSSSVYGANPLLPKIERTWTQPLSPYAASKLAGEGYMLGYQASYGLPTLVFRFFNVFGPWQRPDHDYAAVVPKWLWRALAGQAIEVHGDGTQTRDFTYVDSVVDVLMQALDRRITLDTPVNLAFGRQHSLLDLLGRIETLLGTTLKVDFLPPRVGDVRNSENDPALLESIFPSVEPVDLDPALERTAAWLREYHR